MVTLKTAGRIGQAWGRFHSDPRFTEELGWTATMALDRARHYAAHDLLRAFFGVSGRSGAGSYTQLRARVGSIGEPYYESYHNLLSRLSTELVKSFHFGGN